MARVVNPRKRRAPDASPSRQQQPPRHAPKQARSYQYPPGAAPLNDENFLRWDQTPLEQTFPDPTTIGYNEYSNYANVLPSAELSAHAGLSLQPSNQMQPLSQLPPQLALAPRPVSTQLIARGPPQLEGEDWMDVGDGLPMDSHHLDGQSENGFSSMNFPTTTAGDDDIQELEEQAAAVKHEAEAKGKKIAPFVLKLSSFLEDPRNEQLIRWADHGRSFVVLDEDEFARRLIPELFKHSNYASFVRQLNMYGFHKKVGLSDNSMRASERRNKSPNEYANQYFIKDHPNLLWLIKKTKSPPSATRGGRKVARSTETRTMLPPDHRDGSVGTTTSMADVGEGEEGGGGLMQEGESGGPRSVAALTQDLAHVRRQLQTVTDQQRVITSAIHRLRQEHKQVYEQAGAFQALHERHENSINAILAFLATVYSRNVEGQGVGQGGASVATVLANHPLPETMQQGNERGQGVSTSPFRRQHRLLLGPSGQHTVGGGASPGQVSSLSPAASAISDRNLNPNPNSAQPIQSTGEGVAVSNDGNGNGNSNGGGGGQAGTQAVSDIVANSPDSDLLSFFGEGGGGSATPRMTFPSVVATMSPYTSNTASGTGGNEVLTSSQRNDMLQWISRGQNSGAATTVHTGSLLNNHNNNNNNNTALTTVPSSTPALLNLARLHQQGRHELDDLQRRQAEQDANLQQLKSMIQPLSPTGSIPGLPHDAASPVVSVSSPHLASTLLQQQQQPPPPSATSASYFNGVGSTANDATNDGLTGNTPTAGNNTNNDGNDTIPTLDMDMFFDSADYFSGTAAGGNPSNATGPDNNDDGGENGDEDDDDDDGTGGEEGDEEVEEVEEDDNDENSSPQSLLPSVPVSAPAANNNNNNPSPSFPSRD